MTVLGLQWCVSEVATAPYPNITFSDLMFHFGKYAVSSWHHFQAQVGRWNGTMVFCFFSSRLFAAIRSQGAVLLVSFQALGRFLYWPVSRCAKSKRQSPNIKSTDESGWMGGETAGVCGVWWELCEEVTGI